MHFISDENTFYQFSEMNEPVLSIKPGDTVEFETKDCLSNVLEEEGKRLEETSFDKNKVNPATGPVYIEGAMPGDTLEIKIEKIRLKDRAVITCQAGYGVIGKYFDDTTYRITPIKGDELTFAGRFTLKTDPMVGVLGVTPKGAPVPTGMLGDFGGNMDNTMMREGATLFLPVFVDGALAAVGDVHALMGDGEINCSAIEAPAYVTLTFKIRKDLKIRNPILRTDDYFCTISSEGTLDQAADVCVEEMALILRERMEMDFDDISMLMSAVGNLQICQTVSPLKTARYLMPMGLLESCGFRF